MANGNNARKQKRKVGKYCRHEALDRTYVAYDMVNSYLMEHHYFTSGLNKEYNDHVQKAFDHLWQAYQLCNKDHESK